jgi:hypothetical protein
MPMPLEMMGQGIPQAQIAKDALARQNGFPSYDAMILFQANKERQLNPAANVQAPLPVSPKAQEVGSSWGIAPLYQYLANALAGKH